MIEGSYPTSSTQYLRPNTALLLFYQIFSTIKYVPILESVLIKMFMPYIKSEWQPFNGYYPVNFPQYCYSWIKPSLYIPNTLDECIVYGVLDIIFNYNHELEFFWDHTKTMFMVEDYKNYAEERMKFSKIKNVKELEELDEIYRKVIMAKVNGSLTDIFKQHKELSNVFGIAIGFAKTENYKDTKSILDTTKEICDFISSKKSLKVSNHS